MYIKYNIYIVYWQKDNTHNIHLHLVPSFKNEWSYPTTPPICLHNEHNVKQNSIIHVTPSLNLYWEHIFLDTAVYHIYPHTYKKFFPIHHQNNCQSPYHHSWVKDVLHRNISENLRLWRGSHLISVTLRKISHIKENTVHYRT
jgi:hypothetical protein